MDPVFYLKAVIAIAALGLVVLPLGADAVNAVLKPVRGDAGACRVLSVIDGDTLSIWCAETGIQRARLTGFDTPELFSPGCASEFLAAQRATWALRGLIFSADRVAISIRGRDRYDRALASLRIEGSDVAARMIAMGHARAYQGGVRQGWCGAG
jgi:endonuclease YncB( thermonuclease family)